MAMINNANAVLFDLCTRLKDNGVNVKVSGGYEYSEDCSSIDFDEKISDIDFTEHDKRFKDEITQLKHDLENVQQYADEYYNKCIDYAKQIAELESELEVKENLLKIKNGLLNNNDDLPDDPIEVAQMLINLTYEYELSDLEKALYKCGDTRTTERYSIDDLEQIAEHLLVYCKHNKEEQD